MTDAVEGRAECPILRTHQRFILKHLHFTQQYASMYRCRIEQQYDDVLAAVQRMVPHSSGGNDGQPPKPVRVLELQPGVPGVCVGVLYKQMKLLPRFLDEYQKELVRIDAGGEEGDDDDGDAMAVEEEEAVAPTVPGTAGGSDKMDENSTQAAVAAVDEHFNVCGDGDELLLEDSSGRVVLRGLQERFFFTGLVLGIYGTLQPCGEVLVHRYALTDVAAYMPLLRPVTAPPCYIAFVCDLRLSAADAESLDGTTADPDRALLELLMRFIEGEVEGEALVKASRISRLVIGGNSIAATDEQRLKHKVKLDPSDHARLNSGIRRNTGGGSNTASPGSPGGGAGVPSAKLMRELDAVLARLAASVEVELMPGDTDMSDAFFPQQPIHPVLLPRAARLSSLRLVTNPFEFAAQPDTGAGAGASAAATGPRFFVTSGQNVNDVARQSHYERRVDAMGTMLQSGCSCPTAPNTLFSYPFRDTDPFLFGTTPHCFIACDQPRYETRYTPLSVLRTETHHFLRTENEEAGTVQTVASDGGSGRAEDANKAVRLVTVPSFHRSGQVVLVDINSPTLETTTVDFQLRL